MILIRSSQTTYSSLFLLALFDYRLTSLKAEQPGSEYKNATHPQQFAQFDSRSQQNTFVRRHAGQLTSADFNFAQLKFVRNSIMRSSSDSHKAHK